MVLCSEGLHKGASSTILQLPKGISSSTVLQDHNMSKENVFLDLTVLPCESERDKKWDPGVPSFIPVAQPMDGNTNSKSCSHRKPETQAFNRLAERRNYVPIRNRKYRFLISWQKKSKL